MGNRQSIIDIDIFYPDNKIILVGTGSVVERDLSDFLSIENNGVNLFNSETFYSYNSVQKIKKGILSEIRKLTVASASNSKELFFKALGNLNSGIKESLVRELSLNSEKFLKIKDICYTDSTTGAKNSLFFKRYFGKDDYDFNDFNDLDDFNELLDYMNGNLYNGILCCEINNLKAINHFANRQYGDTILNRFVLEITDNYPNVLIVRHGGDEFIVLGNDMDLDEIRNMLKNSDFLDILNNDIPKIDYEGIEIFATISIGQSSLYAPSLVSSVDDVIEFKKNFNGSYYVAQSKIIEDKIAIKEKYGHSDLKSAYKNMSQFYEYHEHLSNKNKQVAHSSIDGILDSIKGLNLNDRTSLGLKGLK